jgi:BASS family bile acid:Na+ symporter
MEHPVHTKQYCCSIGTAAGHPCCHRYLFPKIDGHAFFDSGLLIFLGIFLHNALGYLTGYGVALLARMPLAKRRTVAIEVGIQNAGLATHLATRHFPTLPEAAIASAVSCVWHSLSGSLVAGLFQTLDRRKTKGQGTKLR